MKLPPTARPSLARIITLRLAITSVLAVLLQLTIVVARTYLAEDDLNKNYVTREAYALLSATRSWPQGIHLKPGRIPHQYVGKHAASYAFRILAEDGRVIAERNGAALAELSPWRARPSRTQDLWMLDLDAERKLYVAGGTPRQARHARSLDRGGDLG